MTQTYALLACPLQDAQSFFGRVALSFGLIPEWLVRFRIRQGNTIIIVWKTPSNERPFQLKVGAMAGMRIKLRIKIYGALLDFAAWMIPALAGATRPRLVNTGTRSLFSCAPMLRTSPGVSGAGCERARCGGRRRGEG